MSMFDDDSYNEGVNAGKRIAIGSVIASGAVLMILLVTVLINREPASKKKPAAAAPYEGASEVQETVKADPSGRTSDELAFWNMYDDDTEDIKVPEDRSRNTGVSRNTAKTGVSKNKVTSMPGKNEPKVPTFNIARLGEEPEYVSINEAIPKNELSEADFKMKDGRLSYSQGGRSASYFGIDVSKYNGTISWNKVKNDGVDFALLRVGARGYSTGTVILDDHFAQNYKGCKDNGIDVGVYFFSQAINTTEAMEEANYCVAALGGERIKYPIIFDSEKILNDNYRTENLSSTELTTMFRTFADVVRGYGYVPMLAGTKEQLVKRFDLHNLGGYDIWLLDNGEKTEYPYRYCIRQYSDEGEVEGVNGAVNYDICLISYGDR